MFESDVSQTKTLKTGNIRQNLRIHIQRKNIFFKDLDIAMERIARLWIFMHIKYSVNGWQIKREDADDARASLLQVQHMGPKLV